MVSVSLHALDNVPEVAPGDDLATIACDAMAAGGVALDDGDVLVLAQKIVSKAEGRYVRLADIAPTQEAMEHARVCGKDPRLVELILRESVAVLRCVPGVIIVRHRLGLVLANAGIDHSNLPDDPDGSDGGRVLLLPQAPDDSARRLRDAIAARTGRTLAVLIIDSLGRAWRKGTVGTCIGAAGFRALWDRRGEPDLYGRTLQATVIGLGDALAAASSLVMGEAAEGRPLVLAKGLSAMAGAGCAADLVRPVSEDLFP